MKNERLAFPAVADDFYERGMSLRDYLAGQALAGILAYPDTNDEMDFDPVVVAERSYAFASAMIAEREKNDNA